MNALFHDHPATVPSTSLLFSLLPLSPDEHHSNYHHSSHVHEIYVGILSDHVWLSSKLTKFRLCSSSLPSILNVCEACLQLREYPSIMMQTADNVEIVSTLGIRNMSKYDIIYFRFIPVKRLYICLTPLFLKWYSAQSTVPWRASKIPLTIPRLSVTRI